MIKIILIIGLILTQNVLRAQQNAYLSGPEEEQIDSLQRRFLTETNDTLKLAINRNLAFYFAEIDRDSSRFFSEKQLDLAKKLDIKIWEADALWLLSYTWYAMGNYTAAFRLNTEAITLLSDVNIEKNAWKPNKLSKDGTPETARLTLLALAIHNRGHMYDRIGNQPESFASYRRAIEIAESLGDDALVSLSYADLGMNYYSQNKPDSARFFTELSLKKNELSGYKKYRGLHLSWLGQIYQDEKNYQKAKDIFEEAVVVSLEQNNKTSLASAYHSLADLSYLTGDLASSLLYAHKSREISESSNNLQLVQRAYNTLSSTYEKQNDIDQAYYYLAKALEVSENRQEEENIRQANNHQFTEQLRLRDLEESRERSQSRLRLIILTGVLFTIMAFAFLLYRNSRQKHSANLVLGKALDNLKSTQTQLIQSEKMASLGELTAGIAHEIQNPLNFVNNFADVSDEMLDELKVELDKGDIAEAKVMANDVKANLQKITHHGKRADAIVKGMLAHSRAGSSEKQPTNINALADEYLRLSYNGIRAKNKKFNSDFKTDFDENLPKLNVGTQDIGRVLLNLFNNAFYAVHEKAEKEAVLATALSDNGEQENLQTNMVLTPYTPKVVVKTELNDGKVTISVTDNANGIPSAIKEKIFQPFFTTKPTGEGTGLGLSLSYDIVKAHGGTLRVETRDASQSTEKSGTHFIIEFPAG